MTTLRAYAPRFVFALGGLLAALSSVLPWVQFPFFGAVTLWGFRGILGDTADEDVAGLAPTGLLLTALGMLILGLGTIAYAAVVTSTGKLRRGVLISGGLTTVLGIAALVQAILMTSDVGSISAAPIVLLIGGVMSLSSYFLINSNTRGRRLPTAPQHVSLGVVGAGFVAAVIGLVFMTYADYTTRPDDPQDETLQQQQQSSSPDEDWDNDGSTSPEKSDADESSAPDEDRNGSDTDEPDYGDQLGEKDPDLSPEANVVFEFYLSIDASEWQEAWDQGGKSLSPSFEEFKDGYADDISHEFETEKVDEDGTISGTLTATDTDLNEHRYDAWYVVDTDRETIVDGGAEPAE